MRQEEWLIKLNNLIHESDVLSKQEHDLCAEIRDTWRRHYPSCGFCGEQGAVQVAQWNEAGIKIECYNCRASTPICKDVIEAAYLWDAMIEAQETINALKGDST